MLNDGRFYAHYSDHDLTYRSISKFSKRDAEAYDRFGRDVMRQCKIIKPLLKMTPPDPSSFTPKTLWDFLSLQNTLQQRMSLEDLERKNYMTP